MFVDVVDDHHLEIGLGQGPRLRRQHRLVFVVVGFSSVPVQRDVAAAIGAGGQTAGDAVDDESDIIVVAMLELPPDMIECLNSGEGPVRLDQGERIEEARRSWILRTWRGDPLVREPANWSFRAACSTDQNGVGLRNSSRSSIASRLPRFRRRAIRDARRSPAKGNAGCGSPARGFARNGRDIQVRHIRRWLSLRRLEADQVGLHVDMQSGARSLFRDLQWPKPF